jgi:hypothetical protein
VQRCRKSRNHSHAVLLVFIYVLPATRSPSTWVSACVYCCCLVPIAGHRFAEKSLTLCGIDTTNAPVGSSFSVPFVVYNSFQLSATVSRTINIVSFCPAGQFKVSKVTISKHIASHKPVHYRIDQESSVLFFLHGLWTMQSGASAGSLWQEAERPPVLPISTSCASLKSGLQP